MSKAEFGTLEEVDLRKAWENEASSFTPWLAEHLPVLAQVIGIPLEFQGQEVAVESFSADMLARNPWDDSLVLIENQLEMADHNHLGQILTYLAGLEANTIIWIAKDFRDPHLSAVRWLNDHTVGEFAFFAVKLRVVRIGDSPLAPVFEVLVRPNEWERQLHAAAQESQTLSRIGLFRKAFWSNFIRKYPANERDGPAGGNSNRWRQVDSLDLVISYYISVKSVGLFVRGQSGAQNQEVYETLLPHAEQLRAKLGVEIGDPATPYFFGAEYLANTSDEEEWDHWAEWLHNKMNLYEGTLQAIGG